MGTRAVGYGPTGERLRAQLVRLRDDRRLSLAQLSQRLTELGHPIAPNGLSRIEQGERRVDVDDLVALAVALDVSPAALLLPADSDDQENTTVALTSAMSAPWVLAWRWAHGQVPLPPPARDDAGGRSGWDERRRRFDRENRPYVGPDDDIAEVDFLLSARSPGGYDIELHNDGTSTTGTLTRRQSL